jgi:hypothetical protein
MADTQAVLDRKTHSVMAVLAARAVLALPARLQALY